MLSVQLLVLKNKFLAPQEGALVGCGDFFEK